jgi:hypothetical protein
MAGILLCKDGEYVVTPLSSHSKATTEQVGKAVEISMKMMACCFYLTILVAMN